MKSKGVIIKSIETVKHPIKDDWAVRINLICSTCNNEYHIDEYDEVESNKLFKSIEAGNPNRNIFCLKCNKNIN